VIRRCATNFEMRPIKLPFRTAFTRAKQQALGWLRVVSEN
jgi:hypothetical protein